LWPSSLVDTADQERKTQKLCKRCVYHHFNGSKVEDETFQVTQKQGGLRPTVLMDIRIKIDLQRSQLISKIVYSPGAGMPGS
jgi:hypothetical protein